MVHRSTLVGATAFTLSFSAFLWCRRVADQLIDKNGVGNYREWILWGNRSSEAFWISVMIWLCILFFAFYSQRSEKIQLLWLCGLALFAAPAAWQLSMFIE